MSATTTLKAVLEGKDVSMSKTLKNAGDESHKTGKRFGHLREEMRKMGKGGGSLKGMMGGAFADIGAGAAMLGGPMGVAAAGIAGVAAIGTSALIPFAKDAVNTFKDVAGQVVGLRRIMGGTPEDVSRMRFAFKESNVDIDTAKRSMGLFSKNLVNASKDQKKSAEMTKLLGTNFRDAHGKIRPMAELLPEVADKFATMPDGPEKTALAMKLFGKSGAALLPFLNRGSKGIEELGKKSDELGHTLTGKNLEAFKKSRQSTKDWNAAVEGLKIRFGAELLPMLTKVVGWVREKVIPALVAAGKWWQKHSDTITKVASFIGKALEVMWKIQTTIWKAMYAAIQTVGRIFTWLWNNVMQPVITKIIGGLVSLMRMWATMLRGLSKVPGFGWAKSAADKLDRAADKADRLKDSIRKIPNNKNVKINVKVNYNGSGKVRLPNGTLVDIGVWRARAGGGPTIAGRSYLVGENGPELWTAPGTGSITPARQTAQMLRGGSSSSSGVGAVGDDKPLVVQLLLDGRVIHEALVRRKRQTGMALGLA